MKPLANTVLEGKLVGALMQVPSLIPEVRGLMTAEDFYSPANGLIFRTIIGLWEEGQHPASAAVIERLDRLSLLEEAGGADSIRDRWHRASPEVVTSAPAILLDLVLRRRILMAADRMATAARDLSETDPMSTAELAVQSIDVPLVGEPSGVFDVKELATAEPVSRDWLLPELLGRGERLILVGPEGSSKTWTCRQIGMLASAGIHPFTLRALDEPVRVLTVDLENARRHLDRVIRRMAEWCAARGRSVEGMVWHRPAGIDVRDRRDRYELEWLLRTHRPELVVLGPMYKTYRAKGSERDEQAGAEVQAILDDLRDRFGVAWCLEHHSAKAQHGHRDWTPVGWSGWTRWPESGRTLTPVTEADKKAGAPAGAMKVGKFRGDREPVRWPTRLDRGRPDEVPWVAYWADGNPALGPELEPF